MKKHLRYHFTNTHQEWLDFRLSGVGGSDVGCIMGLNPYMSALELFHLKLGYIPQQQEDTLPTFMGNYLEESVARLWQYHESTPEVLMANYAAGRKVRRCRKVNAIVTNPAYPNLFANIDRVINKYPGKGEGILEIKTISGYSLKQWEGGLPPSYVTQLQAYLLVSELEWGEIALMEDGRKLEVLPFVRIDNIIDAIRAKTDEFWERVTEARAIQQSDLPEMVKQARIDDLEPDPDNSLAYEAYLKERYKSNPSLPPIQGTAADLDLVGQWQQAKKNAQAWEDIAQLHRNKLIRLFEHQDVLDFGQAGKVTYKTNSKGVRSLYFGVKQLA